MQQRLPPKFSKDKIIDGKLESLPVTSKGVPQMKLALVDDNPECCERATQVLRKAGYTSQTFTSVNSFKNAYQRDTFDIILLDWVMPTESGVEVLNWLRQSAAPKTPVIVLSARAENCDIASALEAGADDYVTKPFDEAVLLARVKALIRRVYETQVSDEVISVNGIKIDPRSGLVSINGNSVEMTAKEVELAYYLFKNLGRPLSRSYLLEKIWGMNRDVVTRTLDAHISKVRNKLEIRAEKGLILQTIYGYGYRLERSPTLIVNHCRDDAAVQ